MNSVNPETPKGARSAGLTEERAKLDGSPSEVGAFPHVRRTCPTASEKEPECRTVRVLPGRRGSAPNRLLPDDVLSDVMCVGEIVEKYRITRKCVIDGLYARHNPLTGRKSGGTWIITRESVERRWGLPWGVSVNE